MDRLKEDIDQRAEEFGHIEYYDARLQDGHSNELAVATNEVRDMEERRKSLSAVNPLLAKKSDLPPTPQVEETVYEHLSLNLPLIAKNALEELAATENEDQQIGYEPTEEVPFGEVPSADEPVELDEEMEEELNEELEEEAKDEEFEEEVEEGEFEEEEEEEEEEDVDISGDCTVRLVETGPQKLMLVKTIKEWLRCDLKEAKDFVDSAPVDLISDINDEAAEAFAEALREIGATIEITK